MRIPEKIEVDDPSLPPGGKLVFRRTNELRFASPVVTISGHTGDRDIFVTLKGRTHRRRWEKKAQNHLAMLHIACATICLRQFGVLG